MNYVQVTSPTLKHWFEYKSSGKLREQVSNANS
jgi:hypothetical protein